MSTQCHQRRCFERKSLNDLVEVGLIIGPGGHSYGIWGESMNPTPGYIRTTGMVLTHVMAFRSALERGGAPVHREELEGWELPPPTQKLIENGQPTDRAFTDPYTDEELEAVERILS